MKITDEMAERAREMYATFGQSGHLRTTPPSIDIVKAMLTAALAVQTQQGVEADEVLVAIKRQEDEDDIHPLLIAEDSFKDFVEWRLVSALVDVPAVESEPVANEEDRRMLGEMREWHSNTTNRGNRLHVSHRHVGRMVELLTAAHPPRSLSNEGDKMLHLAVAAVLEADTEFRAQMMPGWDGDPLSDELDGLRRIFTALSTRKGSSEGDGSATITKGCAE